MQATKKDVGLIDKQELVSGAQIEREILTSGIVVYER